MSVTADGSAQLVFPLGAFAPRLSILNGSIAPRIRKESSPADEDLELVVGLQNGDEAALSAIMERYKTPLFGFIFRYVRNEADAAEILEETFVKLYLNRQRFRPTAKFRTWLYTIATNICRDWSRRRKRKPALPVGELFEDEIIDGVERDLLLPRPSSPSSDAQEAEEAMILREAIDSLPGHLKSTVILFCLEGHSQDETAKILGCSAKVVETRVYRAKGKLRLLLGSRLDR